MTTLTERYEKLRFKDNLSRTHHYPIICKELSFIFRQAYNKLPKNLQSIIFQDTLAAFRFLPQMQTQNAVSAAHLLLQSAEAALPKQKKNLTIAEFRHAKVAHKRRYKAHQEGEIIPELPQDVLVHIFSFLDIQSLVSAGQVCRSWNFAAINSQLWQSQYAICFGSNHNTLKTKEQQSSRVGEDTESTILQKNIITRNSIDWREAFRKAYIGHSSKLTSNRGYCSWCETIVWLDKMKCCNEDCRLQAKDQLIIPVSSHQVVEYLLYGGSSIFSSDSDSESDEELVSGLWAYPRHIGRVLE